MLLVRMISMMAGQFAEYTSCLAASQVSSSQSLTALFWTSVPDSAYLILLIPSKYCVLSIFAEKQDTWELWRLDATTRGVDAFLLQQVGLHLPELVPQLGREILYS